MLDDGRIRIRTSDYRIREAQKLTARICIKWIRILNPDYRHLKWEWPRLVWPPQSCPSSHPSRRTGRSRLTRRKKRLRKRKCAWRKSISGTVDSPRIPGLFFRCGRSCNVQQGRGHYTFITNPDQKNCSAWSGQRESYIPLLFVYVAVLWIRDFLVRIRIHRSIPLTNGSGSDSFLHWL